MSSSVFTAGAVLSDTLVTDKSSKKKLISSSRNRGRSASWSFTNTLKFYRNHFKLLSVIKLSGSAVEGWKVPEFSFLRELSQREIWVWKWVQNRTGLVGKKARLANCIDENHETHLKVQTDWYWRVFKKSNKNILADINIFLH